MSHVLFSDCSFLLKQLYEIGPWVRSKPHRAKCVTGKMLNHFCPLVLIKVKNAYSNSCIRAINQTINLTKLLDLPLVIFSLFGLNVEKILNLPLVILLTFWPKFEKNAELTPCNFFTFWP